MPSCRHSLTIPLGGVREYLEWSMLVEVLKMSYFRSCCRGDLQIASMNKPFRTASIFECLIITPYTERKDWLFYPLTNILYK